MTENQRKAYDDLSRYKEAKQNIRHMKQKIEEHESKVNRSTRACDSIMRETWRNGKFVAVPVVVQQDSSGNAAEELIAALMDQRMLYVAKQAEAERICMEIQTRIWRLDNPVQSRVLDHFFITGQRMVWIAAKEGYSLRQAKRIKWAALEEYGERMVE